MSSKHQMSFLLLFPLLSFSVGGAVAATAAWVTQLMVPTPLSLLDAVKLGHDDAIFNMMSAGADPGGAVILKYPVLEWKRGDTTSPLLLAIAGGDINKVAYMVKHTRLLTEPPNDLGLCVAAQFGHSNLARLLMKQGASPVPKKGCGDLAKPEDVARKFGSSGLAKELQRYRIDAGEG
jgi:hypothetical protein